MPDEPAETGARHAAPTAVGQPRWMLLGAAALGAAAVVAAAIVVVAWWPGGSADAGGAGDAPHFVDETATSGIDHAYRGEFEFFVGGGVAAFDCDGDGQDELYIAGGTEPAALFRNRSPIGGALRFVPAPSPVTDLTEVTGAYPLDIDSDGNLDLAVLRRGANVVLRGLGDCRFQDATDALGIAGGEDWTVGFSATWEGSNALPTLAFGNYLDLDRSGCADSQVVRPGESGTTYEPPIALSPGYCALSALFSDWNRSGQRDLRLANDRHYYRDGSEQLWRIAPGEAPRVYTEADGWRPLQLWGMGLASQDLTGDAIPEVFITSQGDNKLQTLDGVTAQPSYRDIALERGVTAQRPFTGGDILPSTAWHPEFADVNNDGYVDLFVTKGNVEAQVDYASRDPNNLLLGTADGTFVDGAEDAGIVEFDRSRGATLTDLNLDGLLDLVVVNRQVPVRVWRNVGHGDAEDPEPPGHWLAVRLDQPAPNVDAVGAWLDVRVGDRTLMQEVTVGGGHAGGELGWLHTGLGDADTAEVRVHWPDGETSPWMSVAADQFVTIERGAAAPTPWPP
jgi:hypothetical protein